MWIMLAYLVSPVVTVRIEKINTNYADCIIILIRETKYIVYSDTNIVTCMYLMTCTYMCTYVDYNNYYT